MSNLWFNLRIGVYHIQAGDKKWWQFNITKNEYHRNNKSSKFIELYELSFPKGTA